MKCVVFENLVCVTNEKKRLEFKQTKHFIDTDVATWMLRNVKI